MLNKLYLFSILTILLSCVVINPSNAQKGECTTGNCMNGKGRFIFANGEKYIGEFQNSLPHGRGAYHNNDGTVYRGPFVNGKRQGYGTLTFSNGESYIGEFKNNMRHGEGIYTFKDGKQQKGKWRDGTFVEEIIEKATEIVVIDSGSSPSDSSNTRRNVGQYFKAIANIDTSQYRTALIIGNSAYTIAPLRNPANDAMAMAEVLKRSGFDSYVYIDLDQRTMKKAIREFGEKLKERNGVGLFFYAGHGLQADGRNFLVPTDAKITKVQDIEFESIDLGRILSEFEYAENDMNIIILDACRDNPYKEAFKKSKHASYNGLASIGSAPYNSFIAFSTAPGSVALDGEGTNGLYTQELLKAMSVEGRALEEVFKLVRKSVRQSSGGKQIPWESSSVEDDFYFKK